MKKGTARMKLLSNTHETQQHMEVNVQVKDDPTIRAFQKISRSIVLRYGCGIIVQVG